MTELLIAFLFLALFSIVSFWRDGWEATVLWMLTAGIAIFTGFQWFEVYVDKLGLALSLLLFGYTIFCLAKAYASVFIRGSSEEEE
jgi:glucose-6-phosphate-specific signal transduction histidine kinase